MKICMLLKFLLSVSILYPTSFAWFCLLTKKNIFCLLIDRFRPQFTTLNPFFLVRDRNHICYHKTISLQASSFPSLFQRRFQLSAQLQLDWCYKSRGFNGHHVEVWRWWRSGGNYLAWWDSIINPTAGRVQSLSLVFLLYQFSGL